MLLGISILQVLSVIYSAMLIFRHHILFLALSHLSGSAHTFNPLEHLSGTTPYFEPEASPLLPKPPQCCNITRAAYLIRHAAIYANDFDYEAYIEPFVAKLTTSSIDWSRSRSLSFLATWQCPIKPSDQEELTQAGELESQKLGLEIAQQYPVLRPSKMVWTSQSERTVRSARPFVEGLVRYKNETSVVEVSEGKHEGANSLEPYKSCRGYESSSGASQSKVYPFPPPSPARYVSASCVLTV